MFVRWRFLNVYNVSVSLRWLEIQPDIFLRLFCEVNHSLRKHVNLCSAPSLSIEHSRTFYTVRWHRQKQNAQEAISRGKTAPWSRWLPTLSCASGSRAGHGRHANGRDRVRRGHTDRAAAGQRSAGSSEGETASNTGVRETHGVRSLHRASISGGRA